MSWCRFRIGAGEYSTFSLSKSGRQLGEEKKKQGTLKHADLDKNIK